MSNESRKVYPYPVRATELVKGFPDLSESRLNLTEGQKSQIRMFEGPLFLKLKEIRRGNVEDHVIYPEAFTTSEGKELFRAIYLDPNLSGKVKSFAGERELNRELYDEYFDSLLGRNESDESLPRMGEVTTEDIERLFGEVNLVDIPKRLRERMNVYSSRWAEEKFKKDFIGADGDVDLIQNPKRIRRIVNPDVYKKKIDGLRSFKRVLKDIRSYLSSDRGDVPEAKLRVCNLYQRYINVQIAELLPYGGNPEEIRRPRRLERIDHFLKGVGLEYGSDGLLQTIPEDLAKYAEQRLSELPPSSTPEFLKYNAEKLNADQVKFLAEKVLAAYGFLDGPNPWKAVVLERNTGLAVMFDKKKGTREVRIPKDYKGGLISSLSLIAHEAEGHVLRFANKEKCLGDDLQFTQEFNTGRSGILSEGAAMWLGDEAKQEMVGMNDTALPDYYVALRDKQRGGTFKDCVKAMLETKLKREPNLKLEDGLDLCYERTFRIFRRFTSLDDKSGYITISETLDYIEQEIVVDFLMNHSDSSVLSKILFVAGIDLYSLDELLKIGFLDLSDVQVPKRVVSKEIWPKIKKNLDSGQTLQQAIEAIT